MRNDVLDGQIGDYMISQLSRGSRNLPWDQTQGAYFGKTKFQQVNRDSMKIMNLYDITSTWAASLNIFEGTCVFRSKIGQSQEEQQGFKATVPIYPHCPYLTAGLYGRYEICTITSVMHYGCYEICSVTSVMHYGRYVFCTITSVMHYGRYLFLHNNVRNALRMLWNLLRNVRNALRTLCFLHNNVRNALRTLCFFAQ